MKRYISNISFIILYILSMAKPVKNTMIMDICDNIYRNKITELKKLNYTITDNDEKIRYHIKIAITNGYTKIIKYLYYNRALRNIKYYHECTKNIDSFDFFEKRKLLSQIYDKYTLLSNIIDNKEIKLKMWYACRNFINYLTNLEKNNLIMDVLNSRVYDIDNLYILNCITTSRNFIINKSVECRLFNFMQIERSKEMKHIFSIGFHYNLANVYWSDLMDLNYLDLYIQHRVFTPISNYITNHKRTLLLISP